MVYVFWCLFGVFTAPEHSEPTLRQKRVLLLLRLLLLLLLLLMLLLAGLAGVVPLSTSEQLTGSCGEDGMPAIFVFRHLDSLVHCLQTSTKLW